MNYLPVGIDLSGKQVLVIGSTEKAFSLVRYLSEFSDHLTFLSSLPSGEILDFCRMHGVTVLQKSYSREELYGMDYVFSAPISGEEADDIAAICRTMGISLFTDGRPGKSDFFLMKGEE